MKDFDPNNPGIAGKIFGFPYNEEESDLILIPVPWDVTASYGAGASQGPDAILRASMQLDYEIPGITAPWKFKVTYASDHHDEILNRSNDLRKEAQDYIRWFENGQPGNPEAYRIIRDRINDASLSLELQIGSICRNYIDQEKLVAIVGGDHSTPLGLINELCRKHEQFGILQIDAHMDLRKAYEGLRQSHASIMHNVLKNDKVEKLVQVGIRDYCGEEVEFVAKNAKRFALYFDQNIRDRAFHGIHWFDQVNQIIDDLPQKVYVSFDIDGLDPALCPGTGTPVPGGLSFDEAVFLIREVVRSGREIIGFDLCEVAPGKTEWDANVGARILFQLCSYTGISNGLLNFDA